MSDLMDSTGSLEPFLKGYREQTQKQWVQKQPPRASALDVLDLFSAWGVKSMTAFEIATHLMISKTDSIRFIDELAKRNLVKVKDSPEGGYLVELTQRGEQFTK